jgi:hypothetical protein
MEPWRRHERNQPAEQRERIVVDGDRAVTERILEEKTDASFGLGKLSGHIAEEVDHR